MRVLLWIVVLFTLAVGFTLAGKYDPGYAVLVYPPYRIELSLTLLVVLFLGLLALGHLFFRLASATLRLPEQVNSFHALQREQKALDALNQALSEWFEGRYRRSEKSAAQALAHDPALWTAALIAARAAHEIKAYARRDGYFDQVRQFAPDHVMTAWVIQAACFLEEGNAEAALDRINQARMQDPMHEELPKLELHAQKMLENQDRVLELVGLLEERQLLEEEVLNSHRRSAHLKNISLHSNDLAALNAYWEKTPLPEKTEPILAMAAAREFANKGETAMACAAIENSLAQHWEESLLYAYGEIQGEETQHQIEHAEKWLVEHPEDATLLLILGKLCLRQMLWSRAKSFLESSLAIAPASETLFVLARLLEQTGQDEAACAHYRKGVALLTEVERSPSPL